MSDHNEYVPPNGAPEDARQPTSEEVSPDMDIALPRKKGFTKTAWVLIIALVAVMVGRSHWQ